MGGWISVIKMRDFVPDESNDTTIHYVLLYYSTFYSTFMRLHYNDDVLIIDGIVIYSWCCCVLTKTYCPESLNKYVLLLLRFLCPRFVQPCLKCYNDIYQCTGIGPLGLVHDLFSVSIILM